LRRIARSGAAALVTLVLAACGGSDDGPSSGGVTMMLSAAGGAFDGPGGTQLVVPAGALTQTTSVTVAQTADGAPALHRRLADLDPAAAARMEPSNGRRIVRALEVVTMTGSMPGELTSYGEHYACTYLGVDRADLAERIEQRVDRMWAEGLVDEVRRLEGEGLRDGVTASRALGYAQVLGVLDGRWDEAAARELTVVATRRFARRQRAWFRRDPRVVWLPPGEDLLASALRALDSPVVPSSS